MRLKAELTYFAARIPSSQKQILAEMKKERRIKNMSQAVRDALTFYFEHNANVNNTSKETTTGGRG